MEEVLVCGLEQDLSLKQRYRGWVGVALTIKVCLDGEKAEIEAKEKKL